MQYIHLNHCINFYVPSTELSDPIGREQFQERVNEIAGIFTGLFGGVSIENVQGWYVIQGGREAGSVVTEEIKKLVSYSDDANLELHLKEVLQLAVDKQREWHQESILISIDGKGQLIL